MPHSTVQFDTLEVAKDFLFVEDTDFYPKEIWDDFKEALYLFLTDDEIDVLNYRYGTEDFCSFTVDERRRILSALVLRFNRSEFCSEMDAVMKNYEAAIFSNSYDHGFIEETPDSEEFVVESLRRTGLEYRPTTIGNCTFDSRIGNFPVYVWRFREVNMPLRVLESLLELVSAEGFGRFFIVAHPRMTMDLPISIAGCIPYTFIPLIDGPNDPGGKDESDRFLTM